MIPLEEQSRILKHISSLIHLDDILEYVLEEIDARGRFDGCLINLFEKNSDKLVCKKAFLPPHLKDFEKTYLGYRFDLGLADPNSESFEKGKTIRANIRRIKEALEKTGERFYKWDMTSLAIIPVQNESYIIGTLMGFRIDSQIDEADISDVESRLSVCCGNIWSAFYLSQQEEFIKSILFHKEKTDKIIDFISSTGKLLSIRSIFEVILNELIRTFGFNAGLIWMVRENRLELKSALASNPVFSRIVREIEQYFEARPVYTDPPDSVIASAFVKNESYFIGDAAKVMELPMFEKDRKALQILATPRTTLHMPIRYDERAIGVVTLGSLEEVIEVSEDDMRMIRSLCALIGIYIKNSQLHSKVEAQKREIEDFNAHLEEKVREQTAEIRQHLQEKTELLQASDLFVPHPFLELLGRESIRDLKLGENVQKEITILFSDIRRFTSMSEIMSAEETFRLINRYLGVMGPFFHENNGFIDKYIGDAIMALFESGDDALQTGLQMLDCLERFNETLEKEGHPTLEIGIGINTGTLMLGTIGESHRMDTTVIGDAVNLASRVEELTKSYGKSLLTSEYTLDVLENSSRFKTRLVDQVTVRGKTKNVKIYEVFWA